MLSQQLAALVGGLEIDDVFHIGRAHARRQWAAPSISVAALRHLLDEWGSGLRDRPVVVRFRRLDGDSPRRGAGVARAAETEQKLIHIPQVGYPGWAGKPHLDDGFWHRLECLGEASWRSTGGRWKPNMEAQRRFHPDQELVPSLMALAFQL